jgi:hypothetical protein
MSDLVDQITAVLREHKPTTRRKQAKRPGFIDVVTGCKGCDWTASTLNEELHAAHVAERVAAELQLTEEWKNVHESGGGHIHRSHAAARQHFDSFVERPPGVDDPGSGRYTHIARRWVSAWSEVQP